MSETTSEPDLTDVDERAIHAATDAINTCWNGGVDDQRLPTVMDFAVAAVDAAAPIIRAAHAAEMDALRQRHHREIGAHLAGQHDHADDCAGCSIRADDREVIAQLREELEALKDAGADLDRQALLETIAAGDDERDALRKELEEARRVGAAVDENYEALRAEWQKAVADLAAARAELDEATKRIADTLSDLDDYISDTDGITGEEVIGDAIKTLRGQWRPAPAADDTTRQDGGQRA